ncbi:MAG: ELWxxDGT repeat protein [Acidiferrobacterales bacterium]
MKKQTVLVSTMVRDFMRIFYIAVLMFTLSACGSGGSSDSRPRSNSGTGSGGGSGSGGGTDSALAIRFLNANDGVYGNELWKTDGTAAGTVLVKDINPAPGVGSSPFDFIEFNSAVYFTADDGAHGSELWKTDGTAAGTVLVKDINPAGDSNPYGYTAFNGALYFSANDGVTLNQPWKTDGTAAGTVMVKNLGNPAGTGSAPVGFTELNGALFFLANGATTGGPPSGSGVNNYEVWKTDGTDVGTVLVKTINSTLSGADSNISPFAELNGALYFSANDGGTGRALWKTDGTDAGTVRVTNINAAGGENSYQGSFFFTKFNGALYFNGNDGVNGGELWKTDGTAAGTVMVKDINPGAASSDPFGFIDLNGALYFSAGNGVGGSNVELWKTDGTAAGTVLVKEFNPGAGISNPPVSFTELNGALYFSADDGVHGFEPWKSDGTAAGTVLVNDINPGTASSMPSHLALQGSVWVRVILPKPRRLASIAPLCAIPNSIKCFWV